jgi:hypothetical protein
MSLADYYLLRVYELKPGVEARELEQLAASGLAEMQGWVAGVKRFSLLRLDDAGTPARAETGTMEEAANTARYLLLLHFASYEAYRRWRLVEAEGADFWERYASVMIAWEQLGQPVMEFSGEAVVDVLFHASQG